MRELLEAAWREAQDPKERIDAANRLAQVLIHEDRVRCRELMEETCAAARALDYTAGEATALRQRAACRLMQVDKEGAEADYQRARELSHGAGASEIEAGCLLGLSTLRRRSTHYSEAMALLLEARALHQENADASGEAAVLNNLGALCVELGNYDDARAFLGEGLALVRERALPGYELFLLSNIARIKQEDNDIQGALEDLETCLVLAEREGKHAVRPHLLAALCQVYLKQGRIEEALRVNEEALSLASSGQDRQVELTLLIHLGTICDELGMPEAAEAAFTRVRERTERLGDWERHLEALCQSAAFYQRHGRLPEARHVLDEARERASAASAHRHLVQVLRALAALELEPKARERYESQANAIDDELKQQVARSLQLVREAMGRAPG